MEDNLLVPCFWRCILHKSSLIYQLVHIFKNMEPINYLLLGFCGKDIYNNAYTVIKGRIDCWLNRHDSSLANISETLFTSDLPVTF